MADTRLGVRAGHKSLPATGLAMWRRMVHRYSWTGHIVGDQQPDQDRDRTLAAIKPKNRRFGRPFDISGS
jgi:hypothetical protein